MQPRRWLSEPRGFFHKNAIIGLAEIFGRLPLIFSAGYVAKSLTPSIYASWALVLAYQGLLISVLALGLPTSLARFASVSSPGQARGLFYVTLRLTGVAMVAVLVLTVFVRGPVAGAIGLPQSLAWFLIVSCAIAIMNGWESLLGAYLKSRELAVRYSTSVLARSCIEVTSILVVFTGVIHFHGLHGPKLLILYGIIVVGLKAIVYPPIVFFGTAKAEHSSATDRSTFLKYGIPMIPAGVVVFLTAQGDRLVLGHLFVKHELGIYAYGAALAAYMTYLGYAVNPLFLPRASAMHDAGDEGGVARLFVQSQNVSLALYAFGVAGLVLFGHEAIHLTAGSAYYDSHGVMVLLGAAVGLEAVLGTFEWVFHLIRRPRYVLWFNLGYMLLNIAGVIVSGSLGGAQTVAATVLGTVIVANVVRYAVARRLLPVRIPPGVAIGLVSLAGIAPLLFLCRGFDPELRGLLLLAVVAAYSLPAARSTRRLRPLRVHAAETRPAA